MMQTNMMSRRVTLRYLTSEWRSAGSKSTFRGSEEIQSRSQPLGRVLAVRLSHTT